MFYRLHCFHPPTGCRLCLCEFCLDTGWNYRLWSLEGIRLEHVFVTQRAASSGHTQLFLLTSEVQRSLLSSLPVVGACLKCLTCTAPAAARPGAPEGASSCGSLNCSCWWWQNRSCSTCRGHLERKKRDRDRAAYLTGKCSYRSSILMSVCWDKGLGAKQAGHSYFNKRNKSVFSISLHLHCGWAMKLALLVA